jgi:sugar/nucleoside kinase (ribokinase family)
MSLLVVGGSAIDIIITGAPRLPVWPRHSEFTPANLVLLREAPLVTLGGNGGNAAYVAASSGARVHLATNLGGDAFGMVARHWLKEADCRLLGAPQGQRTAINVTAANARHARATFFYAETPATLPSLRDLPPALTHALVCGWPHPPLPEVARFFRRLKKRGVFTALDAGPFLGRAWTMKELKPLLASLSLLLANEYEINSITRCTHLPDSLREVRRHFAGHVVIKRGRRGALWMPQSANEVQVIAAARTRTANTVGAGDSFNGGLLAALVQKQDIREALCRAVKIAAKVVASKHGVLGAGTSA